LADFGVEEVMLSLDEMASRFSLDRLHTADSHFDVDKLRWISGQHIRALDDSSLTGAIAEFGVGGLSGIALEAARTGGVTFAECAATARLLVDPPEMDEEATRESSTSEADAAVEVLLSLIDSPPESLEAADQVFSDLKAGLKERGVKLGPALHGLRARLTGRVEGPEFKYVLACLTPARLSDLA
jgi:glutamyl-tRNA synthetase